MERERLREGGTLKGGEDKRKRDWKRKGRKGEDERKRDWKRKGKEVTI